jgi:hypothetical protein
MIWPSPAGRPELAENCYYVTLAHVSTGELATAALHNDLLDNLGIQKTSIDDNGHIFDPVIQSKTSNYPIVATDDVVICTSGTFTVTLLTAVGRSGKRFTVKNLGTGVITMASTSAQTIDGAAAASTQLFQFDALTFESDGANWVIV